MKPKRKNLLGARLHVSKRGADSVPALTEGRCPIVGVGASAGGLEAFTQLLKLLPADTGFGFVFVQHLDPRHASALAQLLQRATAMPVHEATHNLRVQANRVYVIAPNASLGIADGVLKMRPRVKHRVAPHSIDDFLEALAKDQGERAIGVILSGSATDGTLGLEAIKAAGGLTFAQDDSARFDSMPRNAVAAGCVDAVLSPVRIAKELARIARHPYVAGRPAKPAGATGRASGMDDPANAPAAPKGSARTASAPNGRGPHRGDGGALSGVEHPDGSDAAGYQKILHLLQKHTGVDFSLYKSATVHRRIARRMVLNRQTTLGGYFNLLRRSTKEVETLYADALINVTSFFRNEEAFDVLQRKVFPALLQERSDRAVRGWVLGCSTGQEAYSLAMAFTESAGKMTRPRKLQIFATDINEANLTKARHGFYPRHLVQDISPERLRRFFVEEDGGYRVIKALREIVVFARQNIISDPPFSRLDFISCRNVMIYLEASLQQKMLSTFHYALNPRGCLLLGTSESIGSATDLFAPLDKRQKLFSKRPVPTAALQLPIKKEPGGAAVRSKRATELRVTRPEAQPAVETLRGELSAEREANRITINQYAPSGVLIDAQLQILQFRGATGAYLEPSNGKASFDVLKMARPGLMLPLRATIARARRENCSARAENVIVTHDGVTRSVNIEVVPLKNLKERCFLVLFEEPGRHTRQPDASDPRRLGGRKEDAARIVSLERELAEARDYLQAVQQRQEAANEELQAANEEGQSANEELQSLNEELETSKEELESTNEELITVNEEMGARNTDLNRLNNDLMNLETSTRFVVVVLGRDLTVRRFSAQAAKQFNLLASDVGRPIGAVRHNLALPGLEALIADVIAKVREQEREVQDRSERWYSLCVRPYVTSDNKVDGAVLVLADIDERKRTEHLIRGAREHAEAILRTVREPLLVLNGELQFQSANEAFCRTFEILPAEWQGRSLFEVDHGSWDFPGLREMLESIIPEKSFFNDFEVSHDFERIGPRTLLLNARVLSESRGNPRQILLGVHDITDRKRVEEALADAQTSLSEHASELEKLVAKRTGELLFTNRRLETTLGEIKKSYEENETLLQASKVMQQKLRQLTHQVITTQEEERKQLSRELHDEVVQTLIGINVDLTALGHAASASAPSVQQKIVSTRRLVEDAVHAVHRFARGLRPAVLDDLGLIAALHAYCKNLATQKKIAIELTAFRAADTLGGAERTVFYRVAQEALTNVARHAQASHVTVVISQRPTAIRMEVSDNGKSFDVEKILNKENNKRLGLVGMRERVEMVGGTLTIESTPGIGTTVQVEVPFSPPKTKS